MAYSSIVKPGDYFNTKLYTGNAGTQSITGVGFQPDWVWCKGRSFVDNHISFDAVRTATKVLKPNLTAAESTVAATLTSFDSDGFSLGSDGEINANNQTFVSWNWKAGNSAGSSNSDGSLTSTVSVNTTAGFSIVKYTGSSSASTIGHGLGVEPKMIIVKNLTDGYEWAVYHKDVGNNKFMSLDLSNNPSTSTVFNNTTPTSSVFSCGGNQIYTNYTGKQYIAYCFAEKKGFSKFGSFTGNGNANGTFIYTGFKPAFYIVKRFDNTGSWIIKDNKRPGYNVNGTYLVADTTIAEATGSGNLATDEYSNGFKMKGNSAAINADGGTYIYLAFAENPLVANSGTDGVPATAR
jgi:hypothetical protein